MALHYNTYPMSIKTDFLAYTTILFSALSLTACFGGKHVTTTNVETMADQLWNYRLSHPDGFTVELSTMTEPTEGIAVAYAATQGCHSRETLDYVIDHAIKHDGFVGGWLDPTDSIYYFESTRLFPEDSLDAAMQFGIANGQIAIYIISESKEIRLK